MYLKTEPIPPPIKIYNNLYINKNYHEILGHSNFIINLHLDIKFCRLALQSSNPIARYRFYSILLLYSNSVYIFNFYSFKYSRLINLKLFLNSSLLKTLNFASGFIISWFIPSQDGNFASLEPSGKLI